MSLSPGLPASIGSSFWEPEICPGPTLSSVWVHIPSGTSLFLSISHYHCSDPPSLSSGQELHNAPGWLFIATAALKSILHSNCFSSYLTKSFPCLSAFNSFFSQKEWSPYAYIQRQARNFMTSIPISHSLPASMYPSCWKVQERRIPCEPAETSGPRPFHPSGVPCFLLHLRTWYLHYQCYSGLPVSGKHFLISSGSIFSSVHL